MSDAAPPTRVLPEQKWIFPATPHKVVDGDTIDVTLDMGLHAYRVERLRLLGVNAPERKGATLAAGNAARAYVVDWIAKASVSTQFQMPLSEWPLIVQTFKSDAFGRYLTLVWRVSDGACLNDDLIRDSMARVDIR